MSVFGLLNASVPAGAIATFGESAKSFIDTKLEEKARSEKDLSKRRLRSASRLLTEKEQKRLQGKSGENPYLAGQNKWDVMYKGVNLLTGNYSISLTDMSFEGGYGIPVNVTRSYSSNSIDEGPFGKGWTLSADVKSTAGGVVKGNATPSRSVPTSFKERPSLQLDDPNVALANGAATQPVSAVVATDASGKEETIQRDVDGVLTTPPWDKSTSDPVYEYVTLNGATYQVLVSNKVTTPDGTVYKYEKRGTYPNGTKPWDDSGATAEAANVLKVTKATDRQGNETVYAYNTSTTVAFMKANGVVHENPLSYVQMPNGHRITFIWGNGTDAPTDRIWKVKDNNDVRIVTYSYTNKLLTKVKTPGLKETTYTYGSVGDYAGYGEGTASNLLTSMTAPNGLTTSLLYGMAAVRVLPSHTQVLAPCVLKMTAQNGVIDWFRYQNGDVAPGHPKAELEDHWQDTEVATTTPTGTLLQVFWAVTAPGRVTEAHDPATEVAISTAWMNDYYQKQTPQARTSRVFRRDTQDLVRETQVTMPRALGVGALFNRNFPSRTTYGTEVLINATYNFKGDPLNTTVTERRWDYGQGTPVVTKTGTAEYTYWGPEKYYQKKAARDPAGRYTYTDYYDSSAAAGKRGQIYRVYSPAFTTFYLDTNVTLPPGTLTDKAWKYQLKPTNVLTRSAEFDYDAKGRTIDAWKLQRTTTNPWTYAQAHTTYGPDTDGSWGQASSVVEDYGGINRTTNTLHYTSWGKADKVQDAKGQIFETTYDLDGETQQIRRTDSGLNQPITTYTYGTTAGTVDFGLPVTVTDGLSGRTQTISYFGSGNGAATGLPSSIVESGGGIASYTTSLTYNTAGDRQTVIYNTPNGVQRWGYYDYVSVGDPTSASRAYQTLAKLDENGVRTGEEFHYGFDTRGHLMDAAFAQSPSAASLRSNGSWYDAASQANRRARAYYNDDAGGRLTAIEHYWDTWNGSTYSSEAILGNTCTYEQTGLNRGLKTQSQFWTRQAPGSSAWTLTRTESYGYDANRDYLTSANYGDGLPNPSPTWTYDASGNRNDAVADNLNRVTSLSGTSVTHDILGNRLTKGSTTYAWDAVGRMTGYNGTATYTYRPDGLRTSKIAAGTTTLYRYDGQMGMQDVETNGSTTTVTNYGLGARGVDYIERVASSTVVGFPIYDAHGNNLATLTRSGTSYAIGDQRSYDAWGGIRAQQSAGDPKLRYCANIGHKQDDESGLIYMRARYYEPSSGRFISEDPEMAGSNAFLYIENCPLGGVDETGRTPDWFNNIINWVINGFRNLGVFVATNHLAKSPASSFLIKAVTGKMVEAGNKLAKIALNLITGGFKGVQSGAQMIRAGGSSATQAMLGALGGAGLCLSGAARVAMGVTLMTIACFMIGLGETLDPKF